MKNIWIGFDGDADVLTLSRKGLGSGQRNNENVLTRTRKMRKSRFKLCLVKRKLLKEII
jgi:hypothetical protein